MTDRVLFMRLGSLKYILYVLDHFFCFSFYSLSCYACLAILDTQTGDIELLHVEVTDDIALYGDASTLETVLLLDNEVPLDDRHCR